LGQDAPGTRRLSIDGSRFVGLGSMCLLTVAFPIRPRRKNAWRWWSAIQLIGISRSSAHPRRLLAATPDPRKSPIC